MSSSANLSRRLSQLEGAEGEAPRGPVILIGEGDDQAEALRRHEAQHGKREGEPLFIVLVGKKPGPRTVDP